jgi:hypothetical protein
MAMPSGGSRPWISFSGFLQPVLMVSGLLVISAFFYFAWWQLAVAMTLIAVGVFVWWRSRQPRQGGDPAT